MSRQFNKSQPVDWRAKEDWMDRLTPEQLTALRTVEANQPKPELTSHSLDDLRARINSHKIPSGIRDEKA
jgi:hypothetical protein